MLCAKKFNHYCSADGESLLCVTNITNECYCGSQFQNCAECGQVGCLRCLVGFDLKAFNCSEKSVALNNDIVISIVAVFVILVALILASLLICRFRRQKKSGYIRMV